MSHLLSEDLKKRVQAIHVLSRKINGAEQGSHVKKLLEMMAHHTEEIPQLMSKDDPHALIETGDLIVLCLELLMEKGADPDQILDTACARFEKKLGELAS